MIVRAFVAWVLGAGAGALGVHALRWLLCGAR